MSNRSGILPLPGFPEAPKNGLQYARRDGGWVQSTSGATISTEPPPEPLINGQLWWDSDSGDTYVWYDDGNTKQWVQQNLSMPPVIIADSPPPGAYNGQIWWDSNSGSTYVRYDDGNSQQWVQISSSGAASGYMLSPRSFGAAGDVVTNDDAALLATVSTAFAGGHEIYWEAGTYLSTASIPNFHNVRHWGPGAIKRASNLFYPCPKTGQTNTIYVGPAGDDLNDGLSGNQRFREIRTAVAALANYGPALDGSWKFSALAGTYKGGIVIPRNLVCRDYITVTGAGSPHPAVPTCIVDKAADPAQTTGISAQDHVRVWFEQILFNGAFEQGVYVRNHSTLATRNIHTTNCVVGIEVQNHTHHQIVGGIISGANRGIEEMFNTTSEFSYAGVLNPGNPRSVSPIIKNCVTGLKRKEASGGHLDYINIEDCETAVEIHSTCNANVGGMSIKRGSVGFALVGPVEIHEYNGVVFGTGVDAPLVKVKKVGNGQISEQMGWVGNGGPSVKTGFGRVGDIAHHFNAAINHTGTLTATVIKTFTDALKNGCYSAEGSNISVRLWGVAGATGANTLGTMTVHLIIGGTVTAGLVIPAGTVAASRLQMEWNMYCYQDGDFQRTMARGSVGAGALPVALAATTVSLDDNDRSVAIRVTLGNATDTFTLGDIVVEG